MTTKKTETPTETPTKKRTPIKTAALALLGVVGVAHIGVLGHLMNATRRPDFPVINFPGGDYSSYEVEATRDGYKIKYRANDPRVLESERQLKLDQKKGGLFGGGGVESRREYRVDQYTMDGVRNLGGGALDPEGKLGAKSEECIRADAGARSQGALAGTSIAAGALVPAVVNIPYIGWLAAGWVTLLGGRVGSNIGNQVGSVFNDC
ncbi:gp163 [Synechococcus phage S-RIM8 A.HR3]|uniref:Gp163 n=2 Tax=Neptunevirus srim18 TaxID=2734121 RepID=A0A1D7SC20_9CAUD|nr:gp163 [Synechococcus phage S-RIM8 A.HR1]YP_009783063.1 hypothetical protein HOQ82_gp091 [Synechococcus phage S-RIM8]AFB15424.1 gp163 [Synechococcus phage S-RIM8 A.HR5]AFB17852.1 gp163 [Synechococcus phage S-RIM8 A.HR3]AGH57894.1 hypothetical protein CPJG_00142 [Synechococcus phage KBS-M-1A]AFB17641.1 gp163 [Synechococcus phage S-RIM8 A.HR1]AOO11186.1 hypothetical protein RW220300_155 [Synechococcus phage S-RIM8]